MSVETRTKTIDGIEFSVTVLPYMKSARLLARLARVAAPSMGAIIGALKDGLSTDIDLKMGAGMVSGLLASVSEEEMEGIHAALLKDSATVVVDGKTKPLWPVMDLVLAGKVDTGFKLLWFALEVNYGNFIDALLAAVGVLLGSRKSPLQAV